MLREGDERAKALLLLALLGIYQSKSMRVNMKEPVELEPMKKIDEIRRFSNKELRLSKESMGALPRSSEYWEPIRKKSYSYVSGIIGMAYNPFLNEDIRDCFFVMKAKAETELIADCHGGIEVNLVTALGFYSMFGSLESLLNLE